MCPAESVVQPAHAIPTPANRPRARAGRAVFAIACDPFHLSRGAGARVPCRPRAPVAILLLQRRKTFVAFGVRGRSNIESLAGQGSPPAVAGRARATGRPDYSNPFRALGGDIRAPGGSDFAPADRTGVLPVAARKSWRLRDMAPHASEDRAPGAAPARRHLPAPPGRLGKGTNTPAARPPDGRRTAARAVGGAEGDGGSLDGP